MKRKFWIQICSLGTNENMYLTFQGMIPLRHLYCKVGQKYLVHCGPWLAEVMAAKSLDRSPRID